MAKKKIESWKDIDGWFNFDNIYDESLSLIKDSKEKYIFVEIGSWMGKSTSYLADKLKHFDNVEFYCVDIFEDIENNLKGKPVDIFKTFKANLKSLNLLDTVNVLKESSQTAFNKFEDNSIDFIFIDGDHSYEGFSKDIKNWFTKLKKKNSIYAGHDYISAPGVQKGVLEFIKQNNIKNLQKDRSSWIIRF